MTLHPTLYTSHISKADGKRQMVDGNNTQYPTPNTQHLTPSTLLAIGLSILLLGCTSAPDATPSTATPPTATAPAPQMTAQSRNGQAQALPITAEAQIAGQTIQLEVARTPQQQEIGLMFRTELASNRGMLFPFEPPRPVQFWMRNTLIPLDMVFMRDGQVKAIAANAAPCTTEVCPLYGTAISVNQVIELPAGRASELGLRVGDRVTIRTIESGASPSNLRSP